jgi:hypothetical protein
MWLSLSRGALELPGPATRDGQVREKQPGVLAILDQSSQQCLGYDLARRV